MRVIIAGSRDKSVPTSEINRLLELAGFKPTEIVSGGARGIDRCGEIWAESNQVHLERFPAHWEKHGKAAGPIRNREMAKYADALLAIPGTGNGTWNMIDEMWAEGKPTMVWDTNSNRFLEDWEIEKMPNATLTKETK